MNSNIFREIATKRKDDVTLPFPFVPNGKSISCWYLEKHVHSLERPHQINVSLMKKTSYKNEEKQGLTAFLSRWPKRTTLAATPSINIMKDVSADSSALNICEERLNQAMSRGKIEIKHNPVNNSVSSTYAEVDSKVQHSEYGRFTVHDKLWFSVYKYDNKQWDNQLNKDLDIWVVILKDGKKLKYPRELIPKCSTSNSNRKVLVMNTPNFKLPKERVRVHSPPLLKGSSFKGKKLNASNGSNKGKLNSPTVVLTPVTKAGELPKTISRKGTLIS